MECSYLFFFFKQKTAYEMRISDWSSDVCSSDLVIGDLEARPSGRSDVEPDDRRGIRIDLAHLGRISVVGKLVEHASYPVAHIVRRFVDRAPGAKLDGNIGFAVFRPRGDRLNPIYAGHAIFAHLRDAAFDDIRRSAAITCLDRHDRRVGVRIRSEEHRLNSRNYCAY